jgi:hypothetical protein
MNQLRVAPIDDFDSLHQGVSATTLSPSILSKDAAGSGPLRGKPIQIYMSILKGTVTFSIG